MFDPLTGLANRTLLQNQLESAIAQSAREQGSFAVMLLDLDRFKTINDTLGHEVGDTVLREVATRLKEVARSEDTVARLGGDEYVLLLRDVKEKDMPAVAAKVLGALDKPFQYGNRSIDLGASLGASLYPSHADEPRGLIRCADSAMYVAKSSGMGYALYSPTISPFSKGRVA
jgi:diguanylate cyclase (GGDEF)-like protein